MWQCESGKMRKSLGSLNSEACVNLANEDTDDSDDHGHHDGLYDQNDHNHDDQ